MLASLVAAALVALQQERVLDPTVAIAERSHEAGGASSAPLPSLERCLELGLFDEGSSGRVLRLRAGHHGRWSSVAASLSGDAPVEEGEPAVVTFPIDALDGSSRVRIRFDGDVTVDLTGPRLEPSLLRVGGLECETLWDPVRGLEFRYDAEPLETPLQPSSLQLWSDCAKLLYRWQADGLDREGVIYVRPVQYGAARGVTRTVAPERGDLRMLEGFVVTPYPGAEPRPPESGEPPARVLLQRGVYWDACRGADTYCAYVRDISDGAQHWWLQSGPQPLDQIADSANARPLFEACVVSPRDSDSDLARMLEDFVRNPRDREALLKLLAAERSKGSGR